MTFRSKNTMKYVQHNLLSTISTEQHNLKSTWHKNPLISIRSEKFDEFSVFFKMIFTTYLLKIV